MMKIFDKISCVIKWRETFYFVFQFFKLAYLYQKNSSLRYELQEKVTFGIKNVYFFEAFLNGETLFCNFWESKFVEIFIYGTRMCIGKKFLYVKPSPIGAGLCLMECIG